LAEQAVDKSNRELGSLNKELTRTVKELGRSKHELEELNSFLETQIAERTKTLTETVSSLHSLIMNARYPLMILRGEQWMIEIANPEMGKLWDKSLAEITGQKLMDILPEIEDQPFPALLRRVWNTGVGYGQEEQIFFLQTPAGVVEKYVSFYYDPIFDNDRNVTGIFVSANDITEVVRSRHLLEDSYRSQQTLNEELGVANEELKLSQRRLEAANNELTRSKAETENERRRLAGLFMEAPAGICILTGPDFIFELINPIYRAIFLGRDLLGKPLLDAIPEMKGHPLIDILKNVYTTGESFEGKEVLTHLARSENANPEDIYWNFIYQARRNEEGNIDGIMVYSYEVTDQVLSRKKVEFAEESLRIATEAAELGTWYVNIDKQEFIASARFKTLFGFFPEENISFEQATRQIDPESWYLVDEAAKDVVAKKEPVSIVYPVTGYHDRKLRWIKSTGKFIENNTGDSYITRYSCGHYRTKKRRTTQG
jgi:PAS domain-containing protein